MLPSLLPAASGKKASFPTSSDFPESGASNPHSENCGEKNSVCLFPAASDFPEIGNSEYALGIFWRQKCCVL